MRAESLYLRDILEAIEKITLYTKNVSFDQFENDVKTIDAVLRNFEIIGEAANNLSEETTRKANDLPWAEIVSMRNALIHEYFGADMAEVWKTVTEDLPILKKAVERLVEE